MPRAVIRTSASQHPDAYTSLNQPRSTYMTTFELADKLTEWMKDWNPKRSTPSAVKMVHWCKIWFGVLPKERIGGRGKGYRIPPIYLYVARAWVQTINGQIRAASRRALLADPKPWILVIGNVGSTHYTVGDVLERVEQVLPAVQHRHGIVQILNVGPMEEQVGEYRENPHGQERNPA